MLPAPKGQVDLLIIAGEHSGDQHAAAMVRDLLRKEPSLKIAALGGPELAAAGAQLLHDLTATSVVGFVEVLAHARFFHTLYHDTLDWIATFQPNTFCFIDYPGFNLRIAAELKKRRLSVKGGGSISTLFYISPQIWAWKAGRRFKMAETLDALAVIFPFEVDCYADTSLDASFVGHPFLAEGHASPVTYAPSGPILLLPGSRTQAVRRIAPPLFKAYQSLNDTRPALVLYPSETIRTVLEEIGLPVGVSLHRTGTPVAASAVLTSSGTMSMHCALAGIPGSVVYKTNPFTYLMGRMLVKTPFIGIANLLLREAMYPEFIQGAAIPSVLADQLRDCLTNPARQARTAEQSVRLRTLLRQPATGTAADWLYAHL